MRKSESKTIILNLELYRDNIAILEERLVSISQSIDNWKTFSIDVDLNEAKDLGVKFMLPFDQNKSLNEQDDNNQMIENEYGFVIVDSVSRSGTAYGKLKYNIHLSAQTR